MTDRDDDFQSIRGASGIGSMSVAVLYGASPTDTGGRWPSPLVPAPMPAPVQPVSPLAPGVPYLTNPVPVPETAEAVAARIKHRIAWLENELRMHAAWEEELATLRRMAGAGPNGGADRG